MKLKKQFTIKTFLNNIFLDLTNKKIFFSKNSALSYKKCLKIIFLFINNHKRLLIISPPKKLKIIVKHIENIKCCEASAFQKNTLMPLINAHDLILVFSIESEEIIVDSVTQNELANAGKLNSVPKNLEERFIKEIAKSNKPLISFGKKIAALNTNYHINFNDGSFKEEPEFMLKVLKKILN